MLSGKCRAVISIFVARRPAALIRHDRHDDPSEVDQRLRIADLQRFVSLEDQRYRQSNERIEGHAGVCTSTEPGPVVGWRELDGHATWADS